MSVEEFLAWEPGDGRAWQLVDGEPQAMSPANATHGTLQNELGRLIGDHLLAQDSPCTAVSACGCLHANTASARIGRLNQPSKPSRLICFEHLDRQRAYWCRPADSLCWSMARPRAATSPVRRPSRATCTTIQSPAHLGESRSSRQPARFPNARINSQYELATPRMPGQASPAQCQACLPTFLFPFGNRRNR